jgi:hypothetical protein
MVREAAGSRNEETRDLISIPDVIWAMKSWKIEVQGMWHIREEKCVQGFDGEI